MTDKYQRFDQFVKRRRHSTAATADAPNQSSHKREPHHSRAGRRGQQEKQIDQTILQLHQAMLDKILAEPALLQPVIALLEQEQQQGLLRHSEYLFWSCAFALSHQSDLFKAALLSTEPQACKYRRRTRLRGILSEQERQQVLAGQWISPTTTPASPADDTASGCQSKKPGKKPLPAIP